METPAKHRLKVQRMIGRGGYGICYKGTYDGVVCAIKCMSSEQHQDDFAWRMFAKEAEVLRKSSHRNIIGFKAMCRLSSGKQQTVIGCDAPVACGNWALVLEYAKGGTLSDKVSSQMISPGSKVYTQVQALGWALDVARGLEYLHMRSPAIMHRDIKLSNVVLSEDDGQMVAKLSDFGLHVVADDTRGSLLRVSTSEGPNGPRSHYYTPSHCSSSTAAAPFTFTSSRSSTTAANAAAAAEKLRAAAAAAGAAPDASPISCISAGSTKPTSSTEDDTTSCRDNSNGSAGSSSSTPRAAASGKGTICELGTDKQQQQQQEAQPKEALIKAAPAASDHYSEVYESGRTASFVGGAPNGRARRVSFNPHTREDTREDSAAKLSAPPPTCGAGDAQCFAEGNGQQQQEGSDALRRSDSNLDGSMCSIVTEGTWVRSGTGLTRLNSSSLSDVETVFNMTGQTGSCMYMAPEVTLRQPYNEKADVFSFGVVLFELMARCLLLFTELPTTTSDPAVTDKYAKKVAAGYRPSCPKTMPPAVWALIQQCWAEEPTERPCMTKVVSVLEGLLQQEQQAAAAAAGRRMSLNPMAAARRMSLHLPKSNTAGGPAAVGVGSAAAGAAAGASVAPGGGTIREEAAAVDDDNAGNDSGANSSSANTSSAGCGCVIC